MNINKAIVKSLYFVITLGTVLLIFYFIPAYAFFKQYIFILLLILYSYPLVILLISLKKQWWLLVELIVLGLISFITIIFWRQIRDSLPPAMIGKSHVVGYAQYYGYPFYLDVTIFFILVLHPVAVFLFFKHREQYKKNKS
jgi:hypothetical protein